MTDHSVYTSYWQRKQLLREGVPDFPVHYWWEEQDGLCDIERLYFNAVKHASSILDVGAGDLRMMHRLRRAGYAGRYETQDIGTEYAYTYQSLDDVAAQYDAILCLDVIEHLPLHEGIALLDRLVGLLAAAGTLIVQTPNARCIRAPLGWDMTHVHCYNAADLWTFFAVRGMNTSAFLVAFREPQRSLLSRLRFLLQAVVVRAVRCDAADNIAIITTKSS